MEEDFLEIIEKNQAIIHKICRLYRNSREDREDLFQEIVYQLWKSFENFKGESKFTTWMYRIALNTALASFRMKKPEIHFEENIHENYLVQEAHMEESQEEQLFNALKKLNASDRAMVSLYLEDISYSEIAKIIGITENNVGVRLNRIKNKLKILIQDYL